MKIQTSFIDKKIIYKKPITLPGRQMSENIFSELLLVNTSTNETHKIDMFGLPGFYQYSLSEKKIAISNFFKNHEFNFNNISFNLPFLGSTPDIERRPDGELLFDIEAALFPFIHYKLPDDLLIRTNSLGIAENFPSIGCVKIKITPHRQALSELCDVLNKKSIEGELPLLRFDGNRQFEIADLLYFLNNLNDSVVNKIEYIEEPFKIFYDLYIFQKIFKLKIAIDESLIYFQENLDLLPPQTPIVLKPALYGISKSFELISKAQQLGHFIIVSSTYQPSSQFFPLLWLAHYADSFSKTPHFHGLDTLNFLPDPYINSQVLNSLSIY